MDVSPYFSIFLNHFSLYSQMVKAVATDRQKIEWLPPATTKTSHSLRYASCYVTGKHQSASSPVTQ